MNNNKEENNVEKDILKLVLTCMITYLLDNKEITSDVSKKELNAKIDSLTNSNFIEEMQIVITINNETYKLFDEQFYKNNKNMAIILASTYLEQFINEFYQSYLLYKKNFSKVDCDNCLKTLKIKDKFGWFYKYSFEDNFDESLYKYICSLFAKRNLTIHYIPEIELLDEEKKEKIHFDFSQLKYNIDLITNKLTKKLNEIFENNQTAQIIYDKYCRD